MINPDKLAGPAAADKAGANADICSSCHQPLTRRGPDGECLRCMIGFALSQDENQQSEGRKASTSGSLRYGHFEVVVGVDGLPVELGSGAMAVTYRAHDTVLNCDVALKVIDQRVAENPMARARFLREARAAAQIHHPNVAGVSHYGEQDGECYYVMELVQGETLEARVRRDGPLSPAQVLEVGIQAARALVTAEACGVVHRDLKPSNLMILAGQGDTDGTDSFVIKVIDFGLAKGFTAESSLGLEQTRSGFVGTPAFASPEQFAPADDARIDMRSDIYSLGVTLWYLLCGRTPFVGRTLADIHHLQLNQPLPIEQLAPAHVPKRFLTALKSMLASDPNARPQSARELLKALCDAQGTTRATRIRVNHRPLQIAVAALLLASVGAGIWWKFQQGPRGNQFKDSIAVLPFRNLSPDGIDAFFSLGFQDEITSDLAHVAALKVIGSQSTKSYVPGQRDYARIGRQLDVRKLLEGDVRREGGRVQIDLRLIDADAPDHPSSFSYERALGEILVLKTEIARALTARLQSPVSWSESAALEKPPTSDVKAYDLYLQARAVPKSGADEAEVRHNATQVITLLDEAVTRDPGFALAYCEMAKAHSKIVAYKIGANAEELTVDHRSLAEVALQKAWRLQPDLGELHLAQAHHFYLVTRDFDQARIEIDLARHALPNDSELEYIAGRIARAQGRWDEAVRCMQRALTLAPRSELYLATMGDTYLLLRRYDDYEAVATTLATVFEPEHLGDFPLERALRPYEQNGDQAPMRAALAERVAANGVTAHDRDLAGLVIALADRDAEAIMRIVAARGPRPLSNTGANYPNAWFEALAARIRGDAAAAHAAFTAARAEVENAFLADPSSARTLSLLAIIDAGLGRTDAAIAEGRRAMEIGRGSLTDAPVLACNLALVYAWSGQLDAAFPLLEEWLNRPAGRLFPHQPTYGDFKLNPVWDELRNDPRFVQLVDRLAPPKPR